jgi:hypothetical protein
MGAAANTKMVVWFGQHEVPEERIRHVDIVMLARVNDLRQSPLSFP